MKCGFVFESWKLKYFQFGVSGFSPINKQKLSIDEEYNENSRDESLVHAQLDQRKCENPFSYKRIRIKVFFFYTYGSI